MDSSEEKIGKVGIDRSRIGGIDGSEVDRILWEDCSGLKGTEDCKVIVEEDCRDRGSHMDLVG